MPIECDPVGLVELRGISGDVLRIEVVVRSRHHRFVIDLRLLIGGLPGERIAGGFHLVHVSIVLLFLGADLLVVLFEFLSRGETWKEGKIRSHELSVTENKLI